MYINKDFLNTKAFLTLRTHTNEPIVNLSFEMYDDVALIYVRDLRKDANGWSRSNPEIIRDFLSIKAVWFVKNSLVIR